MNERKIIDRKYLCNLAKEVGLTTLDLEALGENHHWEIVVEGNLLERMIKIQRQFERLTVISDEECRGFYIEVPRPTPEDCKHSVNHVFSSPTSIINFTSKKPSYDDTRRSGRDNELLQRAQNDL